MNPATIGPTPCSSSSVVPDAVLGGGDVAVEATEVGQQLHCETLASADLAGVTDPLGAPPAMLGSRARPQRRRAAHCCRARRSRLFLGARFGPAQLGSRETGATERSAPRRAMSSPTRSG